MSRFPLLLACLLAPLATLRAADNYEPSPDSKPQPGVPKGEQLKFTFDRSTIFPGTTREYSVYLPPGYDPANPPCLYVSQDGAPYNAPVVFDNLLARKEIPPVVGVFIRPGVVPAANENSLPRFNRSLEYDGLGDSYVRFLLDELLPDVEQKTNAAGQPVRFSKNGNDRAIAGSSSGGICAFVAAWERPDAFSRVFTSVGTYVGLRGGHVFPTLIRKYETKPLRIFLQDGENDLNIYGGDWWMANQSMERSLTFAGYEVNHAWGDGGHNGKHATAIFPEALRWLWKDWPKLIATGAGSPQLQEILLPGEGWKLVAEGYKFTEGAAVNAQGEVFYNDIPNSKTYKISLAGKVSEFLADSHRANGQAFGPDGRLYAVNQAPPQIVAYDAQGQVATITDGFRGNDLVVRHDGLIYVTEPGWSGTEPSKIWLINPKGEKKVVDTGLKFSNGLALSTDQSLLYVGDSRSHWVYSFQIQLDGTLAHKQRYYHLHEPDAADDSGADGMEVDAAGRLYVASRLGIQVCDQAGRVNCIIPTPNGKVSNMTFGGRDLDILFATCGDKVFQRQLKVKGAPSFQAPIKPTAPRL